MTNTDQKPTLLKDASEELLLAVMRRRLIESGSILTRMVRRTSADLLKAHKENQNTAKATRDVSALCLAAQRTMEMTHRLDSARTPADDLTRDSVTSLIELTEAQILEHYRSRGVEAKGAPDRGARAGEGALPVAGPRS